MTAPELKIIAGEKIEEHIVLPPEFSEDRLALRFADRHEQDLRYVAAWGRWLRWTGTYWDFDDTLHAFDLARAICREASVGAKAKIASAIVSAKTVNAVITLARADRRIAATIGQWDADPWLLNTPNGILNLRTGEQRPSTPTDYMTKITGTAVNAACPIPNWTRFLDRVTGGDKALASFLQRMAGYCLTGDTREHALFFVYGTGANGKSTFLGVLTTALGDYTKTAPIETFTTSHGERHPTELAGLRGARLVTSVETEEGRRWAESRIKSLTGGDPIAARFMRQDFFTFVPTFKLVIAGNHKPSLRAVDEAMRRRFNMLPFTVTIPLEERDQELPDKLNAELPGILAWALHGCLDWQRRGLAPPEAVTKATAAYLESEDAMQAWLDDAVDQDRVAWAQSSSLFASWKAWAERAGERPGNAKQFAQSLEARGFIPERKMTGRGFLGLQLRQEQQPYWER